jgi:hypothetical protein
MLWNIAQYLWGQCCVRHIIHIAKGPTSLGEVWCASRGPSHSRPLSLRAHWTVWRTKNLVPYTFVKNGCSSLWIVIISNIYIYIYIYIFIYTNIYIRWKIILCIICIYINIQYPKVQSQQIHADPISSEYKSISLWTNHHLSTIYIYQPNSHSFMVKFPLTPLKLF